MRKLILYIAFITGVQVACAQDALQYSFSHYTSSAGLISNQINSVVQDDDGYIWFGSTDGIQRYDGFRYRSFRHQAANPLSIPSNGIAQLLLDKKKNLWILFSNGKTGIFDQRRFTFRETVVRTTREQALRSPVKRLLLNGHGQVLLLLGGEEVLGWNTSKNEFSAAYSGIVLPAGMAVADIICRPGTEQYWISIQGGSLAVYDGKTKQLDYAGHTQAFKKAIDLFESKKFRPYNLFFDRKNRLWFNTWGSGIPYTHCYDAGNDRLILHNFGFLEDVKTYHETRGFFEQKDGSIWVKGSRIFARYIEDENRFRQVYNGYITERGINYRIITCMFEDRENSVWVGTGNNGVFRFNPALDFFTNITHQHRMTGFAGDGSPMSYAEDKDGSLLIGYWGDGLYRYNKDRFTLLPLNIAGIEEKNGLSIWDMYRDDNSDTIWMASQPGLYIYNGKQRKATYFNPPALASVTIREITRDRQGNVWLGTQGAGLYKWTPGKANGRFENGLEKFNPVPATQVNKLVVDSRGMLWVATSSEGAYVIDPVKGQVAMHFHPQSTAPFKLPEEGVTSFLEYDDTTMLITTSINVLVYNRQRAQTKVLATSEYIRGNIASLEKDQAGHVWVSTSSMLYRADIRKRIFMSFDRNDGLANDYFILSSSICLRDGRLLFGTPGQFIVFDPKQVAINRFPFPEVRITDLSVMNKPLSVDSVMQEKQLSLGPENNSLYIGFSYLKFIKDHAIKFKLEGMDKDWRIADEKHDVYYSYLPPGTYTFHATTINSEGVSGTNLTTLVIRVSPPFWKTWWFFCLLTLVIAAAFYWLDRQRVNKLLALQKVRSEIAGNLHEEVNMTLNNISLLSEMARIKVDKDIERSKEYIDQISHKSHNMINAMDDILWSIDPDNDSMEKSLLRMNEYADSLKNIHGVRINIALDRKVRSLKLDMKMRHEILLIYKEALRLIVEQAGGQHTGVQIDLFKQKLSIRLHDAGASLENSSAETDAMIRDMHARASAIGAELDVQYAEELAILLMVPVNHQPMS